MKKIKLLSLFLALTLILGSFAGCGTKPSEDDNKNTSGETPVTELSFLEGKWSSPSGNVLMFDTEENKYCYETYTGRYGTGDISVVDGEPMIFFDGFLYNFTYREEDGVLFPNQNGSSESAENINRFTFKKDDSAEIHTWGIDDLTGIWQNAAGEAVSIDSEKMEYVACSSESMLNGTIHDNNDGKGLYFTMNGGYAYICPASDNNRFYLQFSSAKPEENNGSYTGVFYRNGDFPLYVDLKAAKFTETDGNVSYFDGMETFCLGTDYTINDDGLVYDKYGHLFKAGYEAVRYDPAEDWGEGWYIIGGKG